MASITRTTTPPTYQNYTNDDFLVMCNNLAAKLAETKVITSADLNVLECLFNHFSQHTHTVDDLTYDAYGNTPTQSTTTSTYTTGAIENTGVSGAVIKAGDVLTATTVNSLIKSFNAVRTHYHMEKAPVMLTNCLIGIQPNTTQPVSKTYATLSSENYYNYGGGSTTLSSNNLYMTHPGSGTSYVSVSQSPGNTKIYFEYNPNVTNAVEVGMMETLFTPSNWFPSGYHNGAFMLIDVRAFFGTNNSFTQLPSSVYANTGQVCMAAFDPQAGKLWFGIAGSWINGGNPSTGTNPTVTISPLYCKYVYVAVQGGASPGAVTLNFGQSGFTYPIPTGFEPLTV